RLDAGAKFDPKYRGERIPLLREALAACRGHIDVLLDLKERGKAYAEAVAAEVRRFGDVRRTIVGVRSVEQAKQFRRLLPEARQLGFLNAPDQIEAFAKAGVDIIRLWPKWLSDRSLVERVRRRKVQLQLNAPDSRPQSLLPLLAYAPDFLLVDDVAAARSVLKELERNRKRLAQLAELVESLEGPRVGVWFSRPGAVTFLNRDYEMLELPPELEGRARIIFDGGQGDSLVLRFRKSAVVFAAFEYNDTGAWSLPDGRPPTDFGWRLWRKDAYRGTSNADRNGKPHYASIYYCEFRPGQELRGLAPWWLCLAIVGLDEAKTIPGFQPGTSGPRHLASVFSYEEWATRDRPLNVPSFKNATQFAQWQKEQRRRFRQRLVFRYDGKPRFKSFGEPVDRGPFTQQEYHVLVGDRRLFRFFRLEPKRPAPPATPHSRSGCDRLPTIVCFMGHGKVRQILEEPDSYQHACAARLAEQGYLVFAMENVGMEPQRDTHLELDRILRLDGYGWYSLLFAHQLMLLDRVFVDHQVDPKRVGVTGVSTGGLLALTAAALDERVAAASVQGIFGSMRVSFIRDRDRHCSCGAIPGLLPEFDLPELALLVAPRPIHISNAAQDGFGPAEARRCVEKITPIYRRVGGPAPEFTSPPGHHEFNFEGAAAFFARTLKRASRQD
ncbi:MAG: hypothetical protein GXP27_13845, partial [Planctomycetes bacterium]|nr:hypothetical protein [Planctomycetota bacterium]